MTCLLGPLSSTQQLAFQQVNSHSHQSMAIINFHNSLLVALGLTCINDGSCQLSLLDEKCNKNSNDLGYSLLKMLSFCSEANKSIIYQPWCWDDKPYETQQ